LLQQQTADVIRRRETPLGSPSRTRTRSRAAHLKQSSKAACGTALILIGAKILLDHTLGG
jgi:hypothetical protein